MCQILPQGVADLRRKSSSKKFVRKRVGIRRSDMYQMHGTTTVLVTVQFLVKTFTNEKSGELTTKVTGQHTLCSQLKGVYLFKQFKLI